MILADVTTGTVLSIDLKTLLTFIGLLIPFIVAIYKLWHSVESNKSRLDKVEEDVKEIKSDKQSITESINQLKQEMMKELYEIKLSLKDKAEREDKK